MLTAKTFNQLLIFIHQGGRPRQGNAGNKTIRSSFNRLGIKYQAISKVYHVKAESLIRHSFDRIQIESHRQGILPIVGIVGLANPRGHKIHPMIKALCSRIRLSNLKHYTSY